MTLVEFLTARLDEDKQVAREAAERDGEHWTAGSEYVGSETTAYIAIGPWDGPLAETGEHIARHDPKRVLAEVDAKRARVAVAVAVLNGSLLGVEPSGDPDIDAAGLMGAQFMAKLMLKIELMPYDQHPDYRQEWAI